MDDETVYPFRIYFWMVRDKVTGKMHRTRWRMTEQDALRYPGAVKIEMDSLLIEGPAGHTGPLSP